MRFRKLIATAVAGATLAGGTALASSAAADHTPPTLAEILAAQGPIGDGNWYDFDIINGVVGAILAANPASPLALAADPAGPQLTVFLPNDRAFQILAADVLGRGYWFADEAQVATDLLAALPIETLETVVLYHVHIGYVDSAAALGVPRFTALPMVAGGDIKVVPFPRIGSAILVDNDRDDLNPTLVRRALDIVASNGVAHGISRVLRPVDL